MQCITSKMKLPCDDERGSVVCSNVINDDQQARALPHFRAHHESSNGRSFGEDEWRAQHIRRLRQPICFTAHLERDHKSVRRQHSLDGARLSHRVKGAQHSMPPHKKLQDGAHEMLRKAAGPLNAHRQRIRSNVRLPSIAGFSAALRRTSSMMSPLGIDTVLITPAEGTRIWYAKTAPARAAQTRPLSKSERAGLAAHGVILKQVGWATPPGLTRDAEACATSQMLKLHVFNMTEYAAVAYVDADISIIEPAGVRKLLRCAAGQKLLLATGSTGAPVNFGMFATMPSAAAFEAAVWYASQASFTKAGITEFRGGWDHSSMWPFHPPGGMAGYGCEQGFVWAFFCGSGLAVARQGYLARSPLAQSAYARFGFRLIPHIVDRCIYNYQRENGNSKRYTCRRAFNCPAVVMIHKQHTVTIGRGRHNAGKVVRTFDTLAPRPGVCGCGTEVPNASQTVRPSSADYAVTGWNETKVCSAATLRTMPGT